LQPINTQKASLEAKLGTEGMARVNEALVGIRDYNNKLLIEAKDAGIISQQSFDAIKKNNQKYIPLQRLDYLAEYGDTLPAGTNSFSVATQNLIKPIKGSERAIADPIESMVRNTYNTVSLVERNKVAQSVAALSKEIPDVVKLAKKGKVVPKGFDKISYFTDGVKQDVIVPGEVAQAMKGMNQQNWINILITTVFVVATFIRKLIL